MKLSKQIFNVSLSAVLVLGLVSCKDGNSVFDPEYEPSRPNPVVTDISPQGGYLAGVDSVIVNGENFVTDPDSMTINFGGSAGVIKKASPTELIVRPGTIHGEDLSVRVSVRGAEFFSDSYPYTLFQPFATYFGLESDDNPSSSVAVDAQNNIYTIIERGGEIRYTRISPDGTITKDLTRYPGETDDDDNPYPDNSTMRFTSYTAMEVGPSGKLIMAQQGLRAVFQKTFGDDSREGIFAVSSNNALQIRDLVFDNNGYLWAAGFGSNAIHRFDAASKNETEFPFEGRLSSIAFYSNENQLFVGGEIDSVQQVWKFDIDGGGNLINGEQYFDFGSYYNGTVSDMIFASNGELLITTGALAAGEERDVSIVRVFPDGTHEQLYEGMLKPGAFDITWRDDKYAVVTIQNENETSVNFLDMYDRERAGIFGFN
jgi:hypothetical protein